MLQRIDELDDFTRKILHMASILGHTFTIGEIVGLSEQVLSIKEENMAAHIKKVEESLKIVVKEGILDDNAPHQSVSTEFFSFQQISSSSIVEDFDEDDEIDDFTDNETVNGTFYQFCHDSWRQAVLSLLLDSYKQDMHLHAAKSIESRMLSFDESDYHTKIRLFNHLKLGRDHCKATVVALAVGKSFMGMSLSLHSIYIYNDTLDMWRSSSVNDDDEMIAGIPLHVVRSVKKECLKSIVQLLTSLGQALGTTLTRKAESGKVFEDALEVSVNIALSLFISSPSNLSCLFPQILRKCPKTSELKDRSFVFPIYSGLFFLLKLGGLVPVERVKDYEHDLVSNFVEETRIHGDPVHYSRSLAMQGEFFSRQGRYSDALYCHERLKRVYNVKKHSALVVAAYNSDRSAQNFGLTANCLYRMGRVKEALLLCDKVLNVLLPQMDLKNVHNSVIMIYPLLWIMKNEKMSKKAANAFKKFVTDPFYLHFGNDGKTATLPFFKPIKVLFTISMFLEGDLDHLDEKELITWALEENSLRISKNLNNAMVGYGRCGASIGSEICLHLSKQTDDQGTKEKLLKKGWTLVNEAMETDCGEHQTAFIDTKPIYDELCELISK